MEHIYWCIGHQLLIENIHKAEGCYIHDSNGKKYLDLESGVWSTPLGHQNLQVIKAIEDQLSKISHTGYCYAHPIIEEAAIEILKISGLSDGKCIFLSSGSEAVEFGVQALKKLINTKKLLTLHDSFLGSLGSSGNIKEQEWYLYDWTPCTFCAHQETCNTECKRFKEIPFEQIGGFVFEPGSSSGLVKFPPTGLIKNIVKVLKENSGYIQVNEVTTGIGRTGEWFGFQHYGFMPDIISIGKGLGNGYPVSAIAISSETLEQLQKKEFKYSQSHQNDPLGARIAKEVLRVMNDNELIDRSKIVGRNLKERLIELSKKYVIIKEVRGRGMMIAIEFDEHNKNLSSIVFEKLFEQGIILSKRPGHNVIRIDPPLIIEEDDIDHFLSIFDRVLHQVKR